MTFSTLSDHTILVSQVSFQDCVLGSSMAPNRCQRYRTKYLGCGDDFDLYSENCDEWVRTGDCGCIRVDTLLQKIHREPTRDSPKQGLCPTCQEERQARTRPATGGHGTKRQRRGDKPSISSSRQRSQAHPVPAHDNPSYGEHGRRDIHTQQDLRQMSATTADFSNLSMTAPTSSMPRLPPVSSSLNLAEAGSSSRYNLPQGAPHDDLGLLNPVSQTYSRLCQLILLHRLSGKPKNTDVWHADKLARRTVRPRSEEKARHTGKSSIGTR